MHEVCFFTAGNTPALSCAVRLLRERFRFAEDPGPQVTHLLLPIPSFTPDGSLKGGGDLTQLLPFLPKSVVIIGGRLNRPELAGYQTIDLMSDPFYLAQNAKITAYCALRYAMEGLPVILEHCPVLVVGWGRIGKCLSRLLQQLGADVTVYARKETDRAACASLGYRVTDAPSPGSYRAIFNTAPAMVLPVCPDHVLKIELASVPGMGGSNILQARFLPARDAPESSGALICDTVCHYLRED